MPKYIQCQYNAFAKVENIFGIRKTVALLILAPATELTPDSLGKEKSLRSLFADNEWAKGEILSSVRFPAVAVREIVCGMQKETSL